MDKIINDYIYTQTIINLFFFLSECTNFELLESRD